MMTASEYTKKHSETGALIEKLMFRTKPSIKSSVESIIQDVSLETGVPVEDIKSYSRLRPKARARQIVMYRAKKIGHSLTLIGYMLNRDHTSVLHGVRLIKRVRAGEVPAVFDAELA